MSNETKEILQVPVPTEAELIDSGPVAHSPEEAAKMLAEKKAKAKISKPKTEADTGASVLKAVGLAACKRHQLAQVWVTSDGQVFTQENDARHHSKNLKNSEIIKVAR